MKSHQICFLLSCVVVLTGSVGEAADPPNYEEHIKPLFRDHCLKCHNSDEANADLDLSSFVAVMKGGSSGPVVKAGLPESSQLYRAMAHLDGAEAMPPESPKLADAKLALVSNWIRSGLIAGKGGKSQLRSVAAMLKPTSPGAPAPMPESLPDVTVTRTVRPPIPQAMATSPGAPLFAVSGQEQVLLFGGRDRSESDVIPVLSEAITRRWSCDDADASGPVTKEAGRAGGGFRFTSDSDPLKIESVIDFAQFEQMTVSMWLKPEPVDHGQTIFGQENGFTLFLEKKRGGWAPRIFLRDQDNRISYFCRVGVIPDNKWSHLAAVWNGRTFRSYVDGQLLVEQGCPAEMKRIQQRPDAIQTIGAMLKHNGTVDSHFAGDLDEIRFYDRALTREEITEMMAEVSQTRSYELLGALPFPEGSIHDLKFSRNGSVLLAAGGRGAHSGRVVLFDVKTGDRIAEIGDEVESVLAADVSADHRFVALGGPGKIVKIFSTESGELLHRIKKHTDWVTAIAFSPDGEFVATGDRSGGIHVWETEKGAIVFTLDEHKVRITDLSWRADGSIIASAADDGNLILWSMKDGFPLRNVVAHASRESPRYSRRTGILAIDFGTDGRLLTSGRDGVTRVWTADGQKEIELNTDSGLPVSAAFLNGPKTAIVGCFDGSLHVFDLTSKTESQRLSTTGASE